MIVLTNSSPTFNMPFNPKRILLFSISGANPNLDLLISGRPTSIPAF